MHSPTTPLPTAERLPILDVLRGFALMGILIMNMPSFSYSGWHEFDGSHHGPSAIDQTVEQVRNALFSGKFNSLFSVLFGLGFTIQYSRMQQADPVHADRLYLKRLMVLLVLGLVHACVLWTGDVLHIYAVRGIVLLLGLRRASDRVLVWIMAGCIVYPLIASLLRVAFVTVGRPDATDQLPDADRHLHHAVLRLGFWPVGQSGAGLGPGAWGLALALFIFFAVQVPWSYWWLKHHDRGPMEALWARLTYGKKPALAVGAASSARGAHGSAQPP